MFNSRKETLARVVAGMAAMVWPLTARAQDYYFRPVPTTRPPPIPSMSVVTTSPTIERVISSPVVIDNSLPSLSTCVESPVVIEKTISSPVVIQKTIESPVLMDRVIERPVIMEKQISSPVIIERRDSHH